MSTEARIELILQNVADVINTVTEANGYHQDLAATRPGRLELTSGQAPVNGTVDVEWVSDEPLDEASASGNPPVIARTAVINCVAYVIASDTDDTPIDTLKTRVFADMAKALMADRTRGGYAIDSVIGAVGAFEDDASQTGVILVLMVQYRTPENDMYAAG